MKMYLFIFASLVFLISSCGPKGNGYIDYRSQRNCGKYAVLQNRSTDHKITFIIEEHLLRNDTPDVFTTKETLEPLAERDLACCEDDYDQSHDWKFSNKKFEIIGAYVVTTP